jgi:hypothetical protein
MINMGLVLILAIIGLSQVCGSSRLAALKLPVIAIPRNQKEWRKVSSSVQPYVKRLPEALWIGFQVW